MLVGLNPVFGSNCSNCGQQVKKVVADPLKKATQAGFDHARINSRNSGATLAERTQADFDYARAQNRNSHFRGW